MANEKEKKGELYASGEISSANYGVEPGTGYCLESKSTRATNRFKDKVVIITGGAGNFGIRCGERFAAEGANIALWDLRDASEAAAKIAKEYKVKAKAYTVNVTKEDVVEEATKGVTKDFGRIDLLFNNAGYQGDFVPAHKYKTEDFRKILEINVTGVFIVMKSVINAMIAQKPQGGAIVNTASDAGNGVPPNMIAYGTSKAAVIHMTRLAAKDCAPYNVRINSVSPAFIGPGFMWTRQIELQANAGSSYYDKDPKVVAKQMVDTPVMKRYGSLDEVMGPVLFLLSDDAGYMTGQDVQINGGIL